VKRILAYGDSNTWGFLPIDFAVGKLERLPFSESWAGIASAQLAPDFEIVVDALPGRTLGVDRPDMATRGLPSHAWNGLAELSAALIRNAPLDAIILALGTNDLLLEPEISVEAYLERTQALVTSVKAFKLPLPLIGMEAPMRVFVMAQHGFGETPTNPNGPQAEQKRALLVGALRAFSENHQCGFIDAAEAVSTLGGDGVHLDRAAHRRLGGLIANTLEHFYHAGERAK